MPVLLISYIIHVYYIQEPYILIYDCKPPFRSLTIKLPQITTEHNVTIPYHTADSVPFNKQRIHNHLIAQLQIL
jgi:hypothetical protein